MATNAYAQPADWYEKNPANNDPNIYNGFGISADAFKQVKEQAVEVVQQIKPPEEDFRGYHGTKHDRWFRKMYKSLPHLDKSKVPEVWFRRAMLKIMQQAQNTLGRRVRYRETKKRKGRGKRASAPPPCSSEDSEDSEDAGDGHPRKRAKRDLQKPDESHCDSDDDSSVRSSIERPLDRGHATRSGSRVTPLRTNSQSQDNVELILVTVDDAPESEPVDMKDILGDEGQPSLDRLKEVLQAMVKARIDKVGGTIGESSVHIRTDIALRSAIRDAATNGDSVVLMRATTSSLPPAQTVLTTTNPIVRPTENANVKGTQGPNEDSISRAQDTASSGNSTEKNSKDDERRHSTEPTQEDSEVQGPATEHGLDGGLQHSTPSVQEDGSESQDLQDDDSEYQPANENLERSTPESNYSSARAMSSSTRASPAGNSLGDDTDTLGYSHDDTSGKDDENQDPQRNLELDKRPAFDEEAYQAGTIIDFRLSEEQRTALENGKDGDLYDDDLVEDNGEALYQQYTKTIDETLSDVLARQNIDSIQLAIERFRLPPDAVLGSTARIKIDPRWLVNPNAALSPHQWEAVHEMLQQEVREEGGGILGDKPGVGKTHTAIFKSYVLFFILRLRYQRDVDLKNNNASRHIIKPADEHGPEEKCPSQSKLPLDCPCYRFNWTFDLDIPKGASLFLTMPSIVNVWAKAFDSLFGDAPILDDPEFPLIIKIEHRATQGTANKPHPDASKSFSKFKNPLTNEERASICRLPQPWGIPRAATRKEEPRFLSNLAPPAAAAVSHPHPRAACFMLLSTPQSVKKQVLEPMTTVASFKHKGERHYLKQCLAVFREVINDEGHNNFSYTNKTMTMLRDLRLEMAEACNCYLRYWMLSGTSRSSGINVIANHVAGMLSRPSWSTSGKVHLQRLAIDDAIMKQSGSVLPFQKIINDWDGLVRDVLHKDPDEVAVSETFLKHIYITGEILRNFLIERTHDTRRPDGGPLVATSDIRVHSRVQAVTYSKENVEYVQELAAKVKAVLQDQLDRRLEDWALSGSKGPRPTRKKAYLVKGYLDFLIASTTPTLVRALPNICAKYNVKGLQAYEIKDWWADPISCPLYEYFDFLTRDDEKWHALQKLLDHVDRTPKSQASAGLPSNMLIGTRVTAISLLYFCGMLRRYGQRTYHLKDAEKIGTEVVTALHGGISVPQRQPHYDALNDDTSKTRFLVTAIELSAEGIPVTGVNHIVAVDPYPKIDKSIQFAGRASRDPQKEKDIWVTQLYHEGASSDLTLISKQNLGALWTRDVDGLDVTGTSKTSAIEVDD